MKVKPMKLFLPHIHYTIHIRKMKSVPAELPNAKSYAEELDENNCAIYLTTKDSPPSIAHEIIHALKYMCIRRDMEFTKESEHMAYIMQYLMCKILGYEVVPPL